jgi:predicted nucleic acid-binding protein
VIGLDTSVLVRYLVGTPVAQARRAAALIDDDARQLGVSIVVLAECAHVLRTQYEVATADIIDALIGFIQRENVRLIDARPELVLTMLVRARSMPGRPIPDAMVAAASMAAGAVPLATFDRAQIRYGIEILEPR